MLLIMLRSTIQKDITWFLMPAHMSFCHILGIRIPTVIMHNNFRTRHNNLKFRVAVSGSGSTAPSIRFSDSRAAKATS